MYSAIPWTEKYRPIDYNNIILSDDNKNIFENILKKKNFPNMLFYGPPGTGKTTTIINLIDKYKEILNIKDTISTIHLNASDDRGIDIIRIQLYNFTKSKSLFNNNIKFIILDEADFMTRNAQQALKCLIQENKENIKFCLICNYISKIDDSLVNEFIKIKFNILPRELIFNYIKNILIKENICINTNNIYNIIDYYNNDVRSMLNFFQSNIHLQYTIIDNSILETLFDINIKKKCSEFKKYFKNIEINCNTNKETKKARLITFFYTRKKM